MRQNLVSQMHLFLICPVEVLIHIRSVFSELTVLKKQDADL